MTNKQSVDYDSLRAQLHELIADEPDALANAANFVALVFDAMPDINWLGIYVLREGVLVLGPFQGKPACVRIPIGQGVCGTAALQMKTLAVPDVQEFDGHIVCDPASRSEIVVPLIRDDRLLGVLDVDSPTCGRFTKYDQAGLEKLCETFVGNIETSCDTALI